MDTNYQNEQVEALESQPKRKRKKWPIALGVVALVMVTAGAGFWVWHEQPSFCGTVCHETMGSYLETWENSNNDNFTVATHAEAEVVCLDCHEATIEGQVAELAKQVTGDYKQPFAKMKTDESFCLRDGCHARDGIVSKTSSLTDSKGNSYNPHTQMIDKTNGADPHSTGTETLACFDCHTMHRNSSEMSECYSCHHTETFAACSDCHDDK